MAELNVLVFSSKVGVNPLENRFVVPVPDNIIPNRFLHASDIEMDWVELNAELCYDCRFVSMLQEVLHQAKYEVNDPDVWTTEGFIVGINGKLTPAEYDYSLIVDRIGTTEFIP
jgi:hypothetical protein